ncbi:MAG: cation:proton antiporter [Planctomycetota bacterium]
MGYAFLTDIVLLLGASIPVVLLLRRVELPPLAGFLVVGALLGPHALGSIQSVHEVEELAEIGVALLLFTVGLEFSLPRLFLLRRALLVGGGAQILGTILLVSVLGMAVGVDGRTAVLFAFLAALSSTAVVLKTLADEGEIDTPHGQMSVAILLFQDLAIIPLLLFVPLLGDADASAGIAAFLFASLKAVLAVAFVLLTARYGFSRVATVVVRRGGRELFTLFTVFIALGAAWLTETLELPLALGAFVAGLVVSESEYNHQVVDEILPFRDVFSALFFVSIGMLLDVRVFVDEPVATLALFAGLTAAKAAVLFGVAMYLSRSRRVAMLVAASLFQIGEFSFVLAQQARSVGVLGGANEQRFLAVAVLSMLVTPFVIRFAAQRARRSEPEPEHDPAQAGAEGDAVQVLIAGFGLTGRHLARVLDATGISYRILEMNPDRVREERAKGTPIVLGDSSRADALVQAGLLQAKVVVVAINDAAATRRAVALARRLAPGVQVIVRVRFLADTEELLRLGANQVIPEEFETSLEIFGRVLRELHVPRGMIAVQTELVRREGYQLLRAPVAEERHLAVVGEILANTAVDTLFVGTDCASCGKTLAEIEFRTRTGATVLAAVRGDDEIHGPGADHRLEPGELLIVRGNHEQLDRARDLVAGTLAADDDAAEYSG